MFLDQVAVLSFIQNMNQDQVFSTTGVAKMALDEWEIVEFKKYCRSEFPSQYRWDLVQFCLSFLSLPRPIHNFAGPQNISSPMVHELQTRLDEVIEWAQVTEQLFQLFRYTRNVLGKSWPTFPGWQLSDEWVSWWNEFRSVSDSEISGADDRPPATERNVWDWPEFKHTLTVREQLWNQTFPPEIDPKLDSTMGSHLAAKVFGWDLESRTMITIS
jgi:hypothetical protein